MSMLSAAEYTLLGTEVSLFSGKARAYLRYKQIPYHEVLSSAEVYRTIIIPKTGVSYIPVLLTPDGEAVQDTTEIIDYLESRFPARPIYPSTPAQRLVSLLFEVYGDEWLVIPAMHYRWSFQENLDFIYREFGRTSLPHSSPDEQLEQGKNVAKKFSGFLPVLGISEKTKPAIEAWYEEFLAHLDAHFAQHAFLLGGKPSIGDFGLMGPLYAHLARDPYPGRLMRANAPHVAQWVERMHFKQGTNCTENFLPNDAVPATLFPILQQMFDDHLPVFLDTLTNLKRWRQDQSTKRLLPRSIGVHTFRIRGVEGKRMIFPYLVWMFQRPIDCFQCLTR